MKSSKMHSNISFVILFTFCVHFCVCIKYYNYTLFRGIPIQDSHVKFLRNFTENSNVNFWRPPSLRYKAVDFMVSPDIKSDFLREANKLGLYLTTIIEDVQEAFDKQTVKTYIRRKMDSFDWNNYFRLDDIYQWLKDVEKMHPEEMQLQSIGTTEEDREIMAVKVVLKGSKMRSKVIIEGGIHAREWIAPAFVTYMINEIVHAPNSSDKALYDIALTYEWYFIPVLNPDGYEYSHTEDRLWRKNRKNGRFGVDLNRNFGHAFGTTGVSKKRISEIYCGPHAFSEKESQAIADFVKSKSENLEYYLTFHSYGQYMIIPYANSIKHTDNFKEVNEMCKVAAKAIASRFKTRYVTGTAYDTVGYKSSGVSACWVKKEYRVPYVITFELRDSGHDGFALPTKKILPTCMETMDGILSLLTPRKSPNKKLRLISDSTGPSYILDKIVIVFNVFLFIIVRFD